MIMLKREDASKYLKLEHNITFEFQYFVLSRIMSLFTKT